MVSEKWDIAGSASRCSTCEGEIAPETPFYSVLIAGASEIERRDFCTNCWEKEPANPGEATGGEAVIARWQTVRAPKEAPKRTYVKLDIDLVWRIFSSMAEQGPLEGIEAELRYVLALMLLRRRRLELVGRSSGLLEMRAKKEDTVFQVVDPVLGEDRIREVTDRLGELLWEREFAGLET